MQRRTQFVASGLAVGVMLIATACGSSNSGSSSSTKVDTTPVTLAWNSPPDVTRLPQLVALKLMKEQGYNIKTTVVNGQPVAAQAVVSGNAQISIDPLVTVALAIAQGDPLVIFGKDRNDPFDLVAESSIKSIKQMNGKVVALASTTGSLTAAEIAYTEKLYHVKFDIVINSSSPARAAALLSGKIAATPLELDDVATIEKSAAGKFHVLVSYNQLLPWLASGVLFTTKIFLKNHRSIIQALMTDYVKANKELAANPVSFVKKYHNLVSGYTLSEEESSLKAAIQQHAFEGNGLLTASAENRSLGWFESVQQMTAAQVSKLEKTESQWLSIMN